MVTSTEHRSLRITSLWYSEHQERITGKVKNDENDLDFTSIVMSSALVLEILIRTC